MTTMNLTINGRTVTAQEGQTILEAATAAGIKIPTLCHHPALVPIGACRLCLVEVARQRTLQPACTFPVTDGLEVKTHSPQVEEARRFALELLLSDHPLDCMTCERTGSCELQDLAYEYGIKQSRFPGVQHDYPIDTSNPFYERDYDKCIVCRRCVRACNEINGVEAIGVIQRGFNSKIGTAFDGTMQDSPCEFCGMCVELCPTAALQPKLGKGQGRAWQVEKVATTCPYCGVGCQYYLHVRDGRILGVSSKWDAPSNHGWTCVKGRFGWDFAQHPDRLTKPLIRRASGEFEETTWTAAMEYTAAWLRKIKEMHGADAIGGLSSARCTNEENYLFQKFMRAAIGTNNVDHCARL